MQVFVEMKKNLQKMQVFIEMKKNLQISKYILKYFMLTVNP